MLTKKLQIARKVRINKSKAKKEDIKLQDNPQELARRQLIEMSNIEPIPDEDQQSLKIKICGNIGLRARRRYNNSLQQEQGEAKRHCNSMQFRRNISYKSEQNSHTNMGKSVNLDPFNKTYQGFSIKLNEKTHQTCSSLQKKREQKIVYLSLYNDYIQDSRSSSHIDPIHKNTNSADIFMHRSTFRLKNTKNSHKQKMEEILKNKNKNILNNVYYFGQKPRIASKFFH